MNAFCDGSLRRRQSQEFGGQQSGATSMTRKILTPGVFLIAIVALGGCSLFGDSEPAFPPSTGGPNIATVAVGLPGDSANAEYTDQELRALLGTAPRPLPAPPEKPKSADTNAPDATQPEASTAPAGTAGQPATTPATPNPVPVVPDATNTDPNAYPDINTVPMQRPTPQPDPDAVPPEKPKQSSMLEPAQQDRLTVLTTSGSSPAAPTPLLSTPDQTAQAVTNSTDDMFSKPALPPYSGYDQTQKQPQGVPAQSLYRSPYGGPTQLGQPTTGYSGSVVYAAQSDGVGTQGLAAPGGQPVGLVYFGIGSTQLGGNDRSVLRQIADLQRAYGGVIRIVGHASSRTENMSMDKHQQTNVSIAEARAKAVALQLVRFGVRPLFVQIAGASDSQPLYPEIMPAGEAANRRAEIYLSSN
jgi:outer membrane protein OmpA-like peptidoglycan-associated protein